MTVSESANENTPPIFDAATKPPVNDTKTESPDDAAFNVNIVFPSSDACILQVAASELVQEIYRAIIEREDSCHRTCFQLVFNGQTLDLFADLKSVDGFGEGAEIRVVEERYTTREVRNHVKHIHDILSSIKLRDAYAGREQMSLSFLSSVTMGDILDRKPPKSEPTPNNFLPPSYILPNNSNSEPPLIPLHPYSKDDNDLECVKQLNYSNWNPPPTARRLVGDLLYLVVHTLEGKRCHITASPRGFFVNQITDESFNPAPIQNAYVAHSLVDLLKQLSPAFKKSYEILLKRRANKHPFERFPTPYQVHSWLTPTWDHTLDSVRKEEAFASRMACEENLPGQTRDWNDELQASRELSQTGLQDRLMRDRAVFKSNSDFVAAATRAAVSVVNGDIMAINPGETRKQQMFIWNNMFFSLGFDVKDHYKELGGEAAAYTATASDLNGVRAYSMLDQAGLCTLGTAIVDYRGFRVTAQTIIPGILEKEQEQLVVYGSIDFGKTVADDDKYRDLLSKTAKQLKIRPHTVVDKSGKEVELYSSVDCKGILGNDNRTYVLDLLHTFPPDVNYLGGAPAECRPELSEAMRELGYPFTHRHLLPSLRQELLDAFCESRHEAFLRSAARELHSLRNTAQPEDEKPSLDGKGDCPIEPPKDADADVLLLNPDTSKSLQKLMLQDGSPVAKRTTNLRDNGALLVSELACLKKSAGTDNMEEKADGDDDTKEAVRRACKAMHSLSDSHFEIAFNPDIHQPNITFSKDEAEKIKADEALIREACEFLVLHQIPTFIQDCLAFSVMPQDGRALIEILHQRGINVRYLNRIIDLLTDKENLAYLRRLAVCEVLIRSAKHLFKSYVQEVDPMFLSAAVAHFLNCLFTACPTLQPVAGIDEQIIKMLKNKKGRKRGGKAPSRDSQEEMVWQNETPSSLWNSLNKEAKEYYHIDLKLSDIDSFCQTHSVLRTQLVRSFCQSVGIQLALHEYPLVPPNGAKHHSRSIFTLADVVSLQPLVKHLHPHATDAYTFFNTGQARISAGCLQEGFELISEALNLLNTVYGPLHPDIGACNRLLARLSYVMGEHQTALLFQQRATMISERVHGIDSPSTAAEYIHMALYCFACGHVSIAFQLLYRARYLALLCHGEDHPEIAQIDVNISLMLHAVGEFDVSVTFLENALRLNKSFYGEKSLKEAFNCHLLSRTHSYRGDFRSALDFEKRRYAIYLERFGETSEYTRDSNECLHTLTQQAVTLARHFAAKPLLPSPDQVNGTVQNGKKGSGGHKAGVAMPMPSIPLTTPNFVSILDTLNRVNGIFYLQLSQAAAMQREAGANGKGEDKANATSVEIEEAKEETPEPSKPVTSKGSPKVPSKKAAAKASA